MQGSFRWTTVAAAVLLMPSVSEAAAVRVQNANLAQGTNTVFVKGVTDAILPGTPVYLYNAETGALMASDLDGNKQVAFRVALRKGEKAPCTVMIRAGALGALDAVTAVAQVRRDVGEERLVDLHQGPGWAVVWSAVGGLLAGVVLASPLRRPERDHPDWWDTLARPGPGGSAARPDRP